MRDIVIGQARIKREFLALSICFVAAVLLNVYAIATRGTEWSELLTQLHITLAVAIVLYLMLGIIRLMVLGVWRLVKIGR
jgi:low affinity Fe/Cu permease